MKKVFVLAALVLVVVLGLYSPSAPIAAQPPVPTATPVQTDGDILLEDEASCLAVGGTWNGTVTTCTTSFNWHLSDGDTLTIPAFVTLIHDSGTLGNNGIIINNGTFINKERFINGLGSDFTNNGTFSNDGSEGGSQELENDGTINNHGTFTIELCTYPCRSTLLLNSNSGIINNDGNFINNDRIDNDGTINNCGDFTNNRIYNDGTINNGGTFSGRVIGNPVNEVNDACDDTPPVISANASGTLGDNGWYTSDVAVSWTVTDDESSIISTSGCDTTIINGDTAGTTLTCEASSAGGSNSASVTIQRDATAPTASANISPAANANGWHNSDVTISFSGSDNLSDIANCDAGIVLSSAGTGQSAGGACTDNAGNVSATATASGINIDRTAPVVTVTGAEDGATYTLGSVPAAGCDTSDALSGVATEAILTLSGGNPDGTGSFIATCDSALDNAGNSASANISYTVTETTNTYDFSGFLPPIKNPPEVNTRRARQRRILIRFSLNGNQGLDIFTAGYPASQQIDCETLAPIGDIEPTYRPGSDGLSYGRFTDRYRYLWRTERNWKNTCRRFILGLNDGSEHSALFRFK